MRKFINGAGVDTTAAVKTYLASHRELLFADLYIINTAPQFTGYPLEKHFMVTDYPQPLIWSYKGTFTPGVIKRNELTSKIGLDVSTVDVTWSPKSTELLVAIPANRDAIGYRALTALQGFYCGCYDNATLEIWRCLMPTPGDCDTLGACLWFSGRVGNVEVDRTSAKISVISRTEVLNIQVPTAVIEPQNILAHYATGQPLATAFNGGFNVAAGGTETLINATMVMAAGVSVPDHIFDSGYIAFKTGYLAGTLRTVREQRITGPGTFTFSLYEPMCLLPSPGSETSYADVFVGYLPLPLDKATSSLDKYAGFPYVPSPQDSAVVTW